MRKKNRGGESKIRKNAQTQVCQDGKAKGWLELNMGTLEVKGKAVKTQCWVGRRLMTGFREKAELFSALVLTDKTSLQERLEQSWWTLREGRTLLRCIWTPWCLLGCTARTKTEASARATLAFRLLPTRGWEGCLKCQNLLTDTELLELHHPASCLIVTFPNADPEQLKPSFALCCIPCRKNSNWQKCPKTNNTTASCSCLVTAVYSKPTDCRRKLFSGKSYLPRSFLRKPIFQ